MKNLNYLETEKTHTFYTTKNDKRVPIRLMKTEFPTKADAEEYLNGTPNLTENVDDKGNITLFKSMEIVGIKGKFTIVEATTADSIY